MQFHIEQKGCIAHNVYSTMSILIGYGCLMSQMNRFEYVRLRLTNIIITLEHGIDNDIHEQIGDSQSQ